MKILAALIVGLISPLAIAAEATTEQSELTEASCSFILSRGADKSDFVHVPGLSVLHPSSQAQLNVELDAGVSLEGVVCWRSSAEIGPNDDWVARTGVPLYIKKDSDESDGPTLVLELTDPGYRVRIVSGPELSPAQAKRTISIIDTFNERR